MLANNKSSFTNACVESPNLHLRVLQFLLPEGPATGSYENYCKNQIPLNQHELS